MRFLVIGLGSIGTRHAKNLMALGHDVLGMDVDEKKYGFVNKWEGDPVDAQLICSPTKTHLEYLVNANRPTFVEKPLSHSATEAEQVLKSVDQIVVMGNNLRVHPSVRLARRYIREGAIGQPLWAHICVAQYNNKPEYLRDGVTLNWGSHEIDLALWLLGPATVQAASIDKADTIADICLLHESGCRSVIHLDYLTKSEVRDTIVIGERGRVDVSLLLRAVILKQGDRINPPDCQEGSFDTDYENEMIAFVNAVQGKPWMGAAAQDGLETLKIIDAAKEMAGLPIYEKDLPTAEDVKGILR